MNSPTLRARSRAASNSDITTVYSNMFFGIERRLSRLGSYSRSLSRADSKDRTLPSGSTTPPPSYNDESGLLSQTASLDHLAPAPSHSDADQSASRPPSRRSILTQATDDSGVDWCAAEQGQPPLSPFLPPSNPPRRHFSTHTGNERSRPQRTRPRAPRLVQPSRKAASSTPPLHPRIDIPSARHPRRPRAARSPESARRSPRHSLPCARLVFALHVFSFPCARARAAANSAPPPRHRAHNRPARAAACADPAMAAPRRGARARL